MYQQKEEFLLNKSLQSNNLLPIFLKILRRISLSFWNKRQRRKKNADMIRHQCRTYKQGLTLTRVGFLGVCFVVDELVFTLNNVLTKKRICVKHKSLQSNNLLSLFLRMFRIRNLLFCNWGEWRKKWKHDSTSVPHLQITNLLELCQKLETWYINTHICSFRKYTFQYQDLLNFTDVSIFLTKNQHFFAKYVASIQSNSMKVVLEIFQSCFQVL